MFNFKKMKVEEPKLITDEKEIWYCNEVLPLKAEMSELECKNYKLAKENKQLKEVIEEAFKYVDAKLTDLNLTYGINNEFRKEYDDLYEILNKAKEK